jgi:hypothetical protein
MGTTAGSRFGPLSERARSRCATGATGVTGADIVNIARTLALEPWHFTQTTPAGVDHPAGIVLHGGRRRVGLMFANASYGCVFLLRTSSGAACCGLGDLAPLSCKIYAAAENSEPTGQPSGGTRQASDTEEATGRDDTAELARMSASDQARWLELVRLWNARATDATLFDIEDFQRFMLEAEAARELGAERPEEVSG